MSSWEFSISDSFMWTRVYTVFGVETFEEAKNIFLSKIIYVSDGLLSRESILEQLNDQNINNENKCRIVDGTIRGQGIYDY